MRDWRANKSHVIDAKTLNILSAVHNLLETEEPFRLISGYRTAETNQRLQRSSGGVASNSLHVQGKAADISLNGRSVTQIGNAALQCVRAASASTPDPVSFMSTADGSAPGSAAQLRPQGTIPVDNIFVGRQLVRADRTASVELAR